MLECVNSTPASKQHCLHVQIVYLRDELAATRADMARVSKELEQCEASRQRLMSQIRAVNHGFTRQGALYFWVANQAEITIKYAIHCDASPAQTDNHT